MTWFMRPYLLIILREDQMSNDRKYIVITGSKAYFKSRLPAFDEDENVSIFLDLVKESDEKKNNGYRFDNYASVLIVFNDNYNGIVEQAHDRIGVLIEELSLDNSIVYIHNPPINLKEYLISVKENENCSIDYYSEEYLIDKNEEDFVENMRAISGNIIGQE